MLLSNTALIVKLYGYIENLKQVDNNQLDRLIAEINNDIANNQDCKAIYDHMLQSYCENIRSKKCQNIINILVHLINRITKKIIPFDISPYNNLYFPNADIIFQYIFPTTKDIYNTYDYKCPLLIRNIAGYAECYNEMNRVYGFSLDQSGQPLQLDIEALINNLNSEFDLLGYDYYFFNTESKKTYIELCQQIRIAGVNILSDLIGRLKNGTNSLQIQSDDILPHETLTTKEKDIYLRLKQDPTTGAPDLATFYGNSSVTIEKHFRNIAQKLVGRGGKREILNYISANDKK